MKQGLYEIVLKHYCKFNITFFTVCTSFVRYLSVNQIQSIMYCWKLWWSLASVTFPGRKLHSL